MTTDTERPDEVAAPHFEARLWQELERVHGQQRRTGSGPDPGPGPGPRGPDWRRSWSLRVGIGLVAAAATLVGVLVVRDPGGGAPDPDAPAAAGDDPTGATDPTDPGTTETLPVSIETRIINATEAAVTDSIVKVTQVDAAGISGDTIMWTDEQSGRFRSLQLNLAGENSFDSGPAVPTEVDTPPPDFPDRPNVSPLDPDVPQILTRTVDYCFQQYTEADNFAVPGSSAASDIREQIESGELVADGTQVHEGRELLKYQEVMLEDPTLTDLGWLLIDPETYRPVYRVGYPGSSAEYTMVIEFLPRTPENLAQLQPPVPAGFEKVDQLRGDGERADAGCSL